MSKQTFPPFSLTRLLNTVFQPEQGERIAVLIDLPRPEEVKGMGFLKDSSLTVQRYAHDVFYLGLQSSVMNELGLQGGELYAYKTTHASNIDLPANAFDIHGKELILEKDIYPNYDIILCISTYSATAPLTAFCKKYGFRGATLHGVNQIILDSGLSVDYEQVSRDAEALRLGLTRADAVELDFTFEAHTLVLRLELSKQDAQKSHGLCRGKTPDVANLPAGEVYFVPTDATGSFPMKWEDGTIGELQVKAGGVVGGQLLRGAQATLDLFLNTVAEDKAFGEIGELGFGTQELPFSGRDIQDEKILGTFHVATGRSDHLGGNITPERFSNPKNASHEDILYAPNKTPEIQVRARMFKNGKETVLIENYEPSEFLRALLAG